MRTTWRLFVLKIIITRATVIKTISNREKNKIFIFYELKNITFYRQYQVGIE